jgi:MFS family permease
MRNIWKAIGVGIFATMVMDLLNRSLASFNLISVARYESIGRIFSNWFRGDFVHPGFGALKVYSNEFLVGISVHYSIGIILAFAYLIAASRLAEETPKGIIAVAYGLSTSVFAWFLMFPAVGLGPFGSAAPESMHLFRTSFVNHLSYGIGISGGLNLAAYLASWKPRSIEGPLTLPLKRTKLAVTLGLSLSSACFSIAFMLGSLSMVRFAGGDGRLSGASAALLLLSASLITFPAGAIKDRFGQKALLQAAGAIGVLAGIAGAVALTASSIPFLCVYLALTGATHGTILMARYAVAELAPGESRGKHMSHVIMGSTVGAIGGPLLISYGTWIEATTGLAPGTASALFTIGFYGLAFAFFGLLLGAGTRGAKASREGSDYTYRDFFGNARIRFAMASMVASQLAMVTAMAVTPAHMHAHHHAMGSISMVLSLHFIGMYGLSFVPGRLADRFGREIVIVLGGVLLASGALLGSVAGSLSAVAGALFLLGLGWNFCFLSSSVVIAESVRGKNVGRLQGTNEFFVNLSSSLASLASGLVVAGAGFSGLLLVSMTLAAVPVAAYFLLRAGRVRKIPAPAGVAAHAGIEA